MTQSLDLLIDADDTLWENNIYYERVIAKVQSLLLPYGVDPLVFRGHLNQTEREHIPVYGYGTVNFTRSLVESFMEFVPDHVGTSAKNTVEAMALDILDHPLELLDGVPETLAYLSAHHSLFLVTKGDFREQRRKIRDSGLRPYFKGVEILDHKNEEIYRALLTKHAWNPDRTWMIGNSPRSDINPAISAGMNAVYIPHPHTWTLEHEEPVRSPRLIELKSFADLRNRF
ncbi:MAG TPA: HAD family hydrolase [Acidobacteriota bacterium]|nr:HAD family hydrolase [Acidobacteriota bacterium]